jgi:hypothetical protein
MAVLILYGSNAGQVQDEIMNSLVEGWTMVIPFCESVTSNADG